MCTFTFVFSTSSLRSFCLSVCLSLSLSLCLFRILIMGYQLLRGTCYPHLFAFSPTRWSLAPTLYGVTFLKRETFSSNCYNLSSQMSFLFQSYSLVFRQWKLFIQSYTELPRYGTGHIQLLLALHIVISLICVAHIIRQRKS
jgi:hypothetical protein